jgi:HEAT repeat protein
MNRRALLLWFCALAPPPVVFGLFVWAGFIQLGRHRSLTDPDPALRAEALRRLDPKSSDQPFIAALTDEDPDVRLLALQRLGWAGPGDAARAHALTPLLNDKHIGIRREAARSLGDMGPNAWPSLREALQDPNPRLRAGAALALDRACNPWKEHPWPRDESPTIVPILKELLNDEDPEVRHNAEEAMKRVGR